MAESLSDRELMQELNSYGEKITLPIKANKRSILVKKLNHLRSRSKPSPEKGRGKRNSSTPLPNLDVLSSDDSDADGETNSHPTPRTVSHGSSNHGSLDASASSKITEVVTRSLRRRPNVSPMGSISARSRPSEEIRGASAIARRPSGRPSLSRREEASESDTSLVSDHHFTTRLYPDLSLRSSARDVCHNTSSQSDVNFESSDSDIDGSSYEVENKSVNTSFSLLRGRRTPASNHVSPEKSLSQYSTVFTPESSFTSRGSATSRKRRRRCYPEHVSLGLVGIALTFFIIITLCYFFVRKETFMGWILGHNVSQASDNTYFRCAPGFSSHNSTKYCCDPVVLSEAREKIKHLFDDLKSRKGRVECEEADEGTERLSIEMLKQDLKSTAQSQVDVDELYECCIRHIIANPHWNLRALASDHEETHAVKDVKFVESAVASMGFFCRLWRSFSHVMWSIFVFFGGVSLLGLLLVVLWWRLKAKEKQEQQVFAMVEQIIDLLKEQHEFSQKDDSSDQAEGLAVQHVRDQLLPPSKRKALQHVWDQAVKFIEANESRVRLETQTIEGEEFAVWRWIQASPNGGKVWQGQAFGEHNDNNSSSIYSPTPCLKIRNMFDREVESEEDWEENVKDALLEKCRDIRSLVHIYVDKSSREGCVYVKCNSKETAGKVRQALHGWWFDGRLVTVKHLKVEHYHNRWPEAKFAWRPLQPSTNQMRSLAQPYHRSSLEMT